MSFQNDQLTLGLTTEQTEKILQFQDLTGIEDITICRDVLTRNQWDLEVAVQVQLNFREGRPSLYATESRPPNVVNDLITRHYYKDASPRPSGFFNYITHAFNSLFSFCVNSFFRFFRYSLGLMRPDPRRALTDPVADVMSFVRMFEEKFGNVHPVFYQGTYSQVLSDAKQELRFLLVYIHENENVEALKFCREVLTNEEVVNYINQQMLFWACSADTAEGYNVFQSLRVASFPAIAVIVLCGNRMTIVGRLIGAQSAATFLTRLKRIVGDYEMNLFKARSDRVERSLTQSLRAQQDQAYLESLRADQEKERQFEAERQAEMEEQLRVEAEQRAENERLEDIARQKIECVTKIPPEPNADDPNAVHVVIKLPCGSRLERRFLSSHSLESIFYYVFCHPLSPNTFEITTNFPKRVLKCKPLNEDDRVATLVEAGLSSREVLFVNDLEA